MTPAYFFCKYLLWFTKDSSCFNKSWISSVWSQSEISITIDIEDPMLTYSAEVSSLKSSEWLRLYAKDVAVPINGPMNTMINFNISIHFPEQVSSNVGKMPQTFINNCVKDNTFISCTITKEIFYHFGLLKKIWTLEHFNFLNIIVIEHQIFASQWISSMW